MHYTILQQSLYEGAWHISLCLSFETLTAARRVLNNLIANYRAADHNLAVRVLNPYEDEMVVRVGWLSSKEDIPSCGQFVILKCPTWKDPEK